jgi:hypothetical protein
MYTEGLRQAQIDNMNENTRAGVEVQNQNTAQQNALAVSSAQNEVEARAKQYKIDREREGRIVNGVTAVGVDLFGENKKYKLSQDYAALAGIRNKWLPMKALHDKHILDGQLDKANSVKAKFIQQNLYDPDDVDAELYRMQSEYRRLNTRAPSSTSIT